MKRKNSSGHKRQASGRQSAGGAALLWDESFLWGIMTLRALQQAGLSCDLVRADDVRKGRLDRYTLLVVPGGWSSNKLKALGEKGADAVRDFVRSGGSYLGFCGGAGLATLDGIGLLRIRRKPTRERVPSFSGRIRLKTSGNAMWEGVRQPVFHAWWPPQFSLEDDALRVLAAYQEALPDSFSSDLNTGDVEAAGKWEELEGIYRINLDPKRLRDDPAVVVGSYGEGRVLLSLVHFDTPDDANGRRVLRNLWALLVPGQKRPAVSRNPVRARAASYRDLLSACRREVDGLIGLGIRNFLWYWRNPLLLQWRRGVRGLEYCTLYIMTEEIAKALAKDNALSEKVVRRRLEAIRPRLVHFTDIAVKLLTRERLAMQKEHITYERSDDPEIQRLREELFSSSKSYGGLFKETLDGIDALLYLLLSKAG